MTAPALAPITINPPPEPGLLADVAALLHGREMPALVGPNGDRISLPVGVYEVLQDVVAAMQEGKAVTIVPQDTVMTTQDAADFLAVSRPTLVKFLEAGRIPFTQPGRHRRVKLADLITFQDQQRLERRAALDEITRDATDGPTTNEFVSTR